MHSKVEIPKGLRIISVLHGSYDNTDCYKKYLYITSEKELVRVKDLRLIFFKKSRDKNIAHCTIHACARNVH